MQVTTEKEAPISGYGVNTRLLKGIDISKPCILLTSNVTGTHTEIGYQDILIKTKSAVTVEKAELKLSEIL